MKTITQQIGELLLALVPTTLAIIYIMAIGLRIYTNLTTDG